jgi:hypothetical protein
VGQFQIAPGCRVDLNGTRFIFALGRTEQWQFTLLRHIEIVDQRAHRGNFGSGEAAEGLKRGNVEQITNARFL